MVTFQTVLTFNSLFRMLQISIWFIKCYNRGHSFAIHKKISSLLQMKCSSWLCCQQIKYFEKICLVLYILGHHYHQELLNLSFENIGTDSLTYLDTYCIVPTVSRYVSYLKNLYRYRPSDIRGWLLLDSFL